MVGKEQATASAAQMMAVVSAHYEQSTACNDRRHAIRRCATGQKAQMSEYMNTALISQLPQLLVARACLASKCRATHCTDWQ
jgi:hypothetical protein